jgi:uncharacterized membrane protein YphA (DoxX/SURF4 family)
MPKSRSRRKRGAAKSTPNEALALQDDLSIIVDGDKVVPSPAASNATPPEVETPKLGVTYSRKTGQPIITVASPVKQSAQPEPDPRSLRSSPEGMPAYGPDGSVVVKKVTKGSDSKIQDAENISQSNTTKDELRQMAKAVALSPEPEESALRKVSSQFQALLNRGSDMCQGGWAATKRFLAAHDVHKPQDVGRHLTASQGHLAQVAFTLRIGLGALFVAGGLNKLSQLLSPAASDAIVASYTSPTGYINEFFMAFLFAPGTAFSFTPWAFLTTLSAFELVTGVMLLAGFLVRPVALIYAFLLWSFVIALPVVTTNGIDPGVKTYMAPAILVQIRDIALSGMMFVLYGLGAGIRSVDYKLFGPGAIKPVMTSDVAGLLLRLSAAVVLLVGGVFAGMPNIKTYIEPGMLLVIVALAILWGGRVTRYAAGVACAVLFVYMLGKLGFDKGLIGNFNAIKRELALCAGAFVLAARDCGQLWTATDVARRLQDGTACAMQNVARPNSTLEPAE